MFIGFLILSSRAFPLGRDVHAARVARTERTATEQLPYAEKQHAYAQQQYGRKDSRHYDAKLQNKADLTKQTPVFAHVRFLHFTTSAPYNIFGCVYPTFLIDVSLAFLGTKQLLLRLKSFEKMNFNRGKPILCTLTEFVVFLIGFEFSNFN